MKWEYQVEMLKNDEHDGDDYEPYLNKMGADGWELCSVLYGGNRLTLHWKRRMENENHGA